jgi:rhodanese-related sulfurtransferase
MKHHIQVETLREWLDRACPVTVVDVRSDDDRAQWAIPGSVHVNAYDALREGRAGPLATFSPPTDRPVVTVCGAGRTSEVAADLLTARGFETYSLVGGMKAWSTAWNVAEVPITDRSVEIVQIRRTGKGCLSYLVASGNDAAVIDPSVSATVYTQIADGHGWQIKHVIETHIHADHLSRARRLAEQTAAQLLLPTASTFDSRRSVLANRSRSAVPPCVFSRPRDTRTRVCPSC